MRLNIVELNTSTNFTIYFITIVTIMAEVVNPLKSLLAQFGGHQWVGKSLSPIIFFVVVYSVLILGEEKDKIKSLYIADMVVAPIISTVVLLGFFLFAYVSH